MREGGRDGRRKGGKGGKEEGQEGEYSTAVSYHFVEIVQHSIMVEKGGGGGAAEL